MHLKILFLFISFVLLNEVCKTDSYECVSVGRFPIYESNCRSYLWCTQTSNGNLVTTVASCPKLSRFNPRTQQCVLSTAYICSEDICEAAESSGFCFKDPNYTRNTTYIQCIEDDTYEVFVPQLSTCPSGQFFVVMNITNNAGCCSKQTNASCDGQFCYL